MESNVPLPLASTSAPLLDRSSPFLPGSRFQIAWDSTSLGLLKECPRKYYYQIVLGWSPRHSNVHLRFGQLYHSGLEGYDHFCASIGKLDGKLTDAEHDAATRSMLRHTWSLAGEYVAPGCVACSGTGRVRLPPTADPLDDRAEPCELCAGTGKQPGRLPEWQWWTSDDPNKNLWTLARSLVWYVDFFRNSPMRTITLSNGKPAVELSFLFQGGEVSGIPYFLCGHLDRMVHNPSDPNGRPAPHDRKTTKGQLGPQFFRQFSPHNQFSLYSAAASVHYAQPTWGVVVDGAQVLVNSTRFERQFIPFPPQIIDEWLDETRTWITLGKQFAEANAWPKNDKSCSNFGGCPFMKVCSKSPSFRQSWLEQDFAYRPWNPLQIRGDI